MQGIGHRVIGSCLITWPARARPRWAQRHRALAAGARAAAAGSGAVQASGVSGQPASSSAQQPVHFSDLPLDRAAHLRSQPEELQQLLQQPNTLLLPLHRGRALVGPAALAAAPAADGLQLRLEGGQELPLAPHSFVAGAPTAEGRPPRWLPLALQGAACLDAALAAALNTSMGLVFLGLTPESRAVFACELAAPAAVIGSSSGGAHVGTSAAAAEGMVGSAATAAAAAAAPAERGGGGSLEELCQWADVRSAGQEMAGGDAAVLALATGLAKWHGAAAFCSRSGRPTEAVRGGHARAPVSSSSEQSSGSGRSSSTGSSSRPNTGSRAPRATYPRVDPAVIVAATCGPDWLLLGRKRSWDAGRYSLLAGFCELGETLEQAAAREVEEESGVGLDASTLSYHSSQPWPFPQSLMIGFVGSTPLQRPNAVPPFHLLSEQGRAAAHEVQMTQREIQEHLLPVLPPVKVDENELEDARWFHRSWLLSVLSPPPGQQPLAAGSSSGGGSAAGREGPAPVWPPRHCDPRYYPRFEGEGTRGFRIPGRYALANRVIWSWLRREGGGSGSGSGSGSGGAGSNGTGATSGAGGASWAGDLLPDVSIDEGTFKYVLLRVTEVPAAENPSSGGDTNGSDGAAGSSSGGGGGGATGGSGALRSKLIVRGDARAAYHDHILGAARAEAAGLCKRWASAGAGASPAGGSPADAAAAAPQAALAKGAGPGLLVEPLGGGRMEHHPDQSVLSVYGYSSAFGQAPHEVTAALLRRWLPFHDIHVSYDGY